MSEAKTGGDDGRRFKLIPLDQLTPEQSALVNSIRGGARSQILNSGATTPGPIGGPFNVMLRSPEAGDSVQRVGEVLRFKTSLPFKLNEMAILITGRYWTAQYEWASHYKHALKAGLDPAIADAIAKRQRPANMDAQTEAVYNFSMELHETKGVSDATYKAMFDLFGERGVVDLIMVNGYYTLISMLLNVDRTPLAGGQTPPLK